MQKSEVKGKRNHEKRNKEEGFKSRRKKSGMIPYKKGTKNKDMFSHLDGKLSY